MLHLIEKLRNLLAAIPAELVQRPMVAGGVANYVEDQANEEIARLGLPFRVTVTYQTPSQGV